MKTLKDYIHLYIGCDIQYPDTDDNLIYAKLSGVTRGDGLETTYYEVQKNTSGSPTVGDYLPWESNGHHNSNALNAKLILRPLSDMTEEEAEELGKIGSEGWRLINPPERERPDLKYGVVFRQSAEVAYMLSCGFDLFGLIDAGLAVSKTEMK